MRLLAAAIFALPLFAAPVFAHDGVSGATKARMDAMSDMGRALKQLHLAMRAGNLMDLPEGEFLIEQLHQTGQTLPALFATREIPEVSEADPAIWEDEAGFAEQISLFNGGVETLLDAYENGERTKSRAALRTLTSACSSCHDTYRTKQ